MKKTIAFLLIALLTCCGAHSLSRRARFVSHLKIC